MANLERLAHTILLVTSLTLVACSARAPYDARPSGSATPARLPADPVPQPEARSRYGNGPIYEVHGQRYEVLDTSYGYQERGVASWYGPKFHGRPTASREPYDMHGMTAAHKSLPLPTYVEVRNLRNNKRVVVRVNDRGPFVHNRIIDLSYSAAMKLDMVRDGTSLVEVRAISFDEPPPIQPAEATATGSTDAPVRSDRSDTSIYVQVGAFGDKGNATRRYRMLKDNGIGDALIHEDRGTTPTLYRVRVGPIADVDQYDRIVTSLDRIGIGDTHLVTE